MRFVHRNPAQSPELLDDPSFKQRVKEVSRSATIGEQIRGNVYDLLKTIRSRARNEISTQFLRKCAYCEIPLDSVDLIIDWFRPAFGAERASGQIDQHHYVWLVGDWENLYLCCSECNRLKRNLFPAAVAAKYGASINQLRRQREGVLLDPCWDHPERVFEISPDGIFRSESKRGTTTIDLLALNRESLRRVRKRTLIEFINSWNSILRSMQGKDSIEQIQKLLDHKAAHVGAIYIFLWQIANGNTKRALRLLIDSGPSEVGVSYLLRALGPLTLEMAEPRYPDSQPALPSGVGGELSFRPVSKVLIENFKGISWLEIEVPRFSDPSLAIVGENAAGKSSVLQAIGLALVGPREANRLVPDARALLSDDASVGRILVYFHEAREVNELYFSRKSRQFFGNASRAVKVFGYGPYRLLAKRELRQSKRGMQARLSSLFDDGAKLNGYHGWISSLNFEQKKDLAEVLQLLLVSNDTMVSVDTTTLRIRTNGRDHPIHSLSSGMQSIVSMCTDLMEALYSAGESVLKDGYVLIVDELDAHLHPAWRLGILQRLQRAFPNAQIMFSTHDPLTLRGMSNHQVHVLARDDIGAVREVLTTYFDGQSIDQVLTSPLFGLFSTQTLEWERDYQEYIRLLLKDEQHGITSTEREELDFLIRELQASHVLGDTPRERLMYAVVDRFLADRQRAPIEWDEQVIAALATSIQDSIDKSPQGGD